MPTDPREVLSRVVDPPTRTERFGPGEHQVYDVYEPAGRAQPTAIVLVHGGFWRAEYDRTHQRPLALGLAGEGYRAVQIEFRRTGMSGGGWPGTCDDVVSAVRQAVAGEGLDRYLLVGHSAGGHLAVWASHHDLPGLAGVVSLAGCLDLARVAELELDGDAAVVLMGGSATERPEAYAAADPAALGPAPVPVVNLHGLVDDLVPAEVGRSWFARAGLPGRDEHRELPGIEHYALIDPLAPTYPVLLEQLRRLDPATGSARG